MRTVQTSPHGNGKGMGSVRRRLVELPGNTTVIKSLKGKKMISIHVSTATNLSFKKPWSTKSPKFFFRQRATHSQSCEKKQKNHKQMLSAAVKIQRWYRRIRHERKLKISKKRREHKSLGSVSKLRHIRVKSADFGARKPLVKAHENLIINKIILAAKNNAVNYLLTKQQNGQLQARYMNYRDGRGNSSLYYAAASNALECVRVLLRNGADPNLKCERGNTPLHMAFKNDNRGIIGLLLSHGGNPEAPNEANETPLFFAVPRTADSYGLRKGLIFNCQ